MLVRGQDVISDDLPNDPLREDTQAEETIRRRAKELKCDAQAYEEQEPRTAIGKTSGGSCALAPVVADRVEVDGVPPGFAPVPFLRPSLKLPSLDPWFMRTCVEREPRAPYPQWRGGGGEVIRYAQKLHPTGRLRVWRADKVLRPWEVAQL